MRTMENIIIERGDLEKIYRSDHDLTLWRGLHIDEISIKTNPLYPDLARKRLQNGKIREPDVEVYNSEINGKQYVKSEEGKGTSVVNTDGMFGYKKWEYFIIPAGTSIRNRLIITKDHVIPRKKTKDNGSVWHYSISQNHDMPVTEFLDALDELARDAGIRIQVRKHANS